MLPASCQHIPVYMRHRSWDHYVDRPEVDAREMAALGRILSSLHVKAVASGDAAHHFPVWCRGGNLQVRECGKAPSHFEQSTQVEITV